MRRVTWLDKSYRPVIGGTLTKKKTITYQWWDYTRSPIPPMQRTEYYMPWGTVTVDELSKMGFAENYTVVLAYDEGTSKWRA